MLQARSSYFDCAAYINGLSTCFTVLVLDRMLEDHSRDNDVWRDASWHRSHVTECINWIINQCLSIILAWSGDPKLVCGEISELCTWSSGRSCGFLVNTCGCEWRKAMSGLRYLGKSISTRIDSWSFTPGKTEWHLSGRASLNALPEHVSTTAVWLIAHSHSIVSSPQIQKKTPDLSISLDWFASQGRMQSS